MSSVAFSGNLVGEANELSGPGGGVDLTDQYNFSADSYQPGTFETNPTDSGVAAADCLCRERAASRVDDLRCIDGTFGCWKAWIADATEASAPAMRFNMAPSSTTPIYEVDGASNPDLAAPLATGGWVVLVLCGEAEDGADICLDDTALCQGGACLGFQPTWITENGTRINPVIIELAFAWTNVLETGLREDDGTHCGNWTSTTNNVSGALGATGSAQDQCGAPLSLAASSWTDMGSQTDPDTCLEATAVPCGIFDQTINCFEDLPDPPVAGLK